jgi:hypothetical protein
MGNQATAKMIVEDIQLLGTETKPGQFWRAMKKGTHLRDNPSGGKAHADQEVDTVLVEEERQLCKPTVGPHRLWLRVVSSRDSGVRGWSAVHDLKTGLRKLEPITPQQKHDLDMAALLKSAQKTAAQWGPVLFCNALHGMQAALSPADASLAPTCGCCKIAIAIESTVMTCPSGCASICFPCAETRVGMLKQASHVADELASSGVRALHNFCTVQDQGHHVRGAIAGVARGLSSSSAECCVRCRQSMEGEVPIVRCCNTSAVCLSCSCAIIARQRQLNAGLAQGQQLEKDLTAMQITCQGGHIRHAGRVVDAAPQNVR